MARLKLNILGGLLHSWYRKKPRKCSYRGAQEIWLYCYNNNGCLCMYTQVYVFIMYIIEAYIWVSDIVLVCDRCVVVCDNLLMC